MKLFTCEVGCVSTSLSAICTLPLAYKCMSLCLLTSITVASSKPRIIRSRTSCMTSHLQSQSLPRLRLGGGLRNIKRCVNPTPTHNNIQTGRLSNTVSGTLARRQLLTGGAKRVSQRYLRNSVRGSAILLRRDPCTRRFHMEVVSTV